MSLTKVSHSMIAGAYINAADYGMLVTATAAVNAAALQAAIDAAPSQSQINLPPGTYDVDATINVTKRLVFVGSVAAGRGSAGTTLRWTGIDGVSWETGGKVFVVSPGPTVLGVTFNGIGFNTTKEYTTYIDGTGTFNMTVQYCQFTAPTYTKAITIKETSGGAQDGAFWTRIRANNFANTWVEVLDDSNATWITENNFFANAILPLAGSSLFVQGNINAVYVDNNAFEGTWNTGIYAADIDLVQGLNFTNNRIENYSGGSAIFKRILNQGKISGNLFNTAPVYGGARNTTAHNSGQSISMYSNWMPAVNSAGSNRQVEISKLEGVYSGKNLWKQGLTNIDWFFGNMSTSYIQNGSAGLRSPVLRLHTPTSGTAQANPTNSAINTPDIQLAIQNQDFVTAVFIVKAKSTNTATSVVALDTGDTIEYWNIPKDDKWHVIRVSRRMVTGDTILRPTVWLAFASAFNAADEVWIGGIGIFGGTGAFEEPYLDAWTTDPASATNVYTWQRGETVRRMAPASPDSIGWVCTASGTPGTWAGYGAVI
jgi:hypothetical protein